MNSLPASELAKIIARVDRRMAKLRTPQPLAGFRRWLKTFIAEKGIDTETVLEVASANGTPNSIPVGCVIEAMNAAPASEQRRIRDMIVRIDFRNGDVLHYFRHLAGALAVNL